MLDRVQTWPGVVDPDALKPAFVEVSHQLADAAKRGDWDEVFGLLGSSHWLKPNSWRIGGTSWFTPLHQAAWHGAPVEVAERLIGLGAWRSLRDADGLRAVDVARARGHEHLVPVLETTEVNERRRQRYDAWDRHLEALISERTATLTPVRHRPVPTEVLDLEAMEVLWFAYPGMYGGFAVSEHQGRLFVESSCRVVGGSGQAHVITESGYVLVEEGFA